MLPADKLPLAVVQSALKDVAKPSPVGTVVDCEIVQVPAEVAANLHLSQVASVPVIDDAEVAL